MPATCPADIRNIVLVGQGGSGKTTLVERLLLATGAIKRMGTVEEGNTVSDWTDLEKEHGFSLQPSVMHFDHEGHTINVVDTPGVLDLLGHAIACLPAAGTAAVVIDAGKGVETATRRMMQIAADRNLPRMIIINKIDEQHADLPGVVEQIRECFGSVCLPINLPTGGGTGVVQVFEDGASGETDFSSIEQAHTQIVEQVVEVDDELMEAYLEHGAEGLDKAKVHEAFEQALREGHLVPICFVSAKSGSGVEDLLHIISSLCPSPEEGNPRTFLRGTDAEPFQPAPDPKGPILTHVFKIASDPFVGKLGIFRVHQGTIASKDEVFLGASRKPIRFGNIFKLQGKEHVEVPKLIAGDIGAVAKVEDLAFDQVIHAEAVEGGVSLKPLPLPKPLYGLAIELTNRADETKFGGAIQKIMAEDPCFVMERIEATHQTVIKGLGELHLRIILEKLKKQYGIELDTSPPKVAYKETIVAKAEGHHRHKKQSGGSGEFGEVYLRMEPLPLDSDEDFEFASAVVGGSVPKQFFPAIEKGVRQMLAEGALAGYPITHVKVEVFDGKYHPVDSKEVAFIKAGRGAFKDAMLKARPVLLEPIVMLEVTAPSQYMGDLTGDLSTKRGRVQDTDMLGSDMCLIRALVPLGELQNYSTELKSITAGSGSFTMDFSHDEQTPPHVQQEVVASYKPQGDD